MAFSPRAHRRRTRAAGALLGLDAVAAAAEGTIYSVKMTTRKPPVGLIGAPHLVKNNISVEGLNTAKLVFSGTAREAAAGFPANVNVAAALSLAGIGPDRTMIDIYADPAMTRNCHSIEVDSDSARFTLSIENIPSENPKTGKNVVVKDVIADAIEGSSLPVLFLAWFGCAHVIEHSPPGRPSVSTLMRRYRRDWMEQFVHRDPRIFDGNILSSLREGTSFYASACMIAIGGGLALIGNTDPLAGIALRLHLTVRGVRAATEDEIEAGSVNESSAFSVLSSAPPAPGLH